VSLKYSSNVLRLKHPKRSNNQTWTFLDPKHLILHYLGSAIKTTWFRGWSYYGKFTVGNYNSFHDIGLTNFGQF